MARDVAIFDMGSVLIGWEVGPPYRPHFDSDDELIAFLRGRFREIYDAVHDGEGTMAECLAPIRSRHPDAAHLIDVYEHRWGDFITEVMHDSVAIVHELHERDVPLYGLSNWPAQVWPPQRVRADLEDQLGFLELFHDIWVSGHHKLRKPDPASYRSALERFDVEPERAVFVDDLIENVEAASQLGLHGVHFQSASQLRRELGDLGLL